MTTRNFLFSLALQGTLRKKRQSILIISILIVSFSFSIVCCSLFKSIVKTNDEYRKETYGEWYLSFTTDSKINSRISTLNFVDSVAVLACYYLDTQYGTIEVGYLEPELLKIGRLKLDEGHWPNNENEIVIEPSILSVLGYNYDLGQTITFYSSQNVTYSYELVGLLHEYSSTWVNGDTMSISLPGIILSKDAVNNLSAVYTQYSFIKLKSDYFKSDELRKQSENTINKILSERSIELMSEGYDDNFFYIINEPILTSNYENNQSDFYILLISIIAFTAVMCIYKLTQSVEIRSHCTLRSIGITKNQLIILSLYEVIILLIPTLVLGFALGILFTKFGLLIFLKSNTSKLYTDIPISMLAIIIILWIAILLISKFANLIILNSTPLTGKKAEKHRFHKQSVLVRNITVFIPLSVFAVAIFLFYFDTKLITMDRSIYDQLPHYNIRNPIENENELPVLAKETYYNVGSIPGIDKLMIYDYMDAFITFDGLDNRETQLLIINSDEMPNWDKAIHFGNEYKDFYEGNTVLLCTPSDNVAPHSPVTIYYDGYDSDLEFILPKDKINITIENQINRNSVSIDTPFTLKVLSYDADFYSYNVELHCKYSIVCSHKFFEKLMSTSKDALWSTGHRLNDSSSSSVNVIYHIPDNIGYRAINLWANTLGNVRATDKYLASFCNKNNLQLRNDRETNMALVQECTQKLLLTAAISLCIGLMSLLILVGILSLESEKELPKYKILKTIGMSRLQIFSNIFTTGLKRGLFASLIGLLSYLFLKTADSKIKLIRMYEIMGRDTPVDFKAAFLFTMDNMYIYDITYKSFILVSLLICLSILFIIIVSKNKLSRL